MNKILSIAVLLFIVQLASAQNGLTPKWIHQQVFVGEDCEFILIQSNGESNIRDARTAALADLRSKILHTDRVSVNQSYTDKSHETYTDLGNSVKITSKQEEEGWLEIKVEGIATDIYSKRIDEFIRKTGNGIEYYA